MNYILTERHVKLIIPSTSLRMILLRIIVDMISSHPVVEWVFNPYLSGPRMKRRQGTPEERSLVEDSGRRLNCCSYRLLYAETMFLGGRVDY